MYNPRSRLAAGIDTPEGNYEKTGGKSLGESGENRDELKTFLL